MYNMQIISYDANLSFFMDEYNLGDYSTYITITNMFFALNLKICKILLLTIRSIFNDLTSYNPTYLQRSYIDLDFDKFDM